MMDKHIENLKYPIRAKTYENDKIHDFHTYAINSSRDNKFISSYQNEEYCIRDFQYLIIYGDIFEKIIEDIYQKGIEEGKKQTIKKNYKVNNVNE